VDEEPDAFLFTGPTGARLLRGNFNKLARWPAAVAELGVPGLHFHDVRHTGNTFAARTGASLRDLMARMGHDSPDAASIYQHATRQADKAIADAVSAQVDAEQKTTQASNDGQAGRGYWPLMPPQDRRRTALSRERSS
jgi:integrase